MKRRYPTKVHAQIAFGGRWGAPSYRALCAARATEWTTDAGQITCQICLRYLHARGLDPTLRSAPAGLSARLFEGSRITT